MGFIFMMSLIAVIGLLILLIVVLFKENKKKFFQVLCVVLSFIFFIAPVYTLTLIVTGTAYGNFVDAYPCPSWAAILFAFGIKGASFSPWVLIGFVSTALSFVVAYVSNFFESKEALFDRIISALLLLAGFSFLFMSTAKVSPSMQGEIDRMLEYANTYIPETEGVKRYEYGFSSLPILLGVLTMLSAILGVFKDLIAFIKKAPFVAVSVVSVIAIALFSFANVYSLPICNFTGLSLIFGAQGRMVYSGVNPAMLVMFLFTLGGVGLAIAAYFMPKYDKLFRIIGAGATLIAGIICIMTTAVAPMGLTPAVATYYSVYVKLGNSVPATFVAIFSGILIVLAAFGYVYDMIVELVKTAKANDNGRTFKFFDTYGGFVGAGIAVVSLVFFALTCGMYNETQKLSYTFMDVLMGKTGALSANYYAWATLILGIGGI
ncbi:MAG: hypothetical protein MJ072_04835, partial [Clostridia bacterium]|nr:hypothetical protein [Clostridia bacterium]